MTAILAKVVVDSTLSPASCPNGGCGAMVVDLPADLINLTKRLAWKNLL
jgi:hypothetical protein